MSFLKGKCATYWTLTHNQHLPIRKYIRLFFQTCLKSVIILKHVSNFSLKMYLTTTVLRCHNLLAEIKQKNGTDTVICCKGSLNVGV